VTDTQAVPLARRLRDEDLAQLGWIRRFTAAPPRLAEIRELYESLGHEVLLDPLVAGELATECQGCTLALSLFRVIYTRPGPSWELERDARVDARKRDGRSG